MRLVQFICKKLKLEINTSFDFVLRKWKEKRWGFDLILLQNSLSYVLTFFDEEVKSFPRFYASYAYT